MDLSKACDCLTHDLPIANFDDITVESSLFVKLLGVYLDNKLNFSTRVKKSL